jgi:hypothetical protein
MSRLPPRLDILPPEQQQLWPALRALLPTGWVLYGGTALALRLGHRISVDFYFSNERPLDRDALFKALTGLRDGRLLQDESHTATWLIPVGERSVKLSFFGTIDIGRIGVPSMTSDGVAELASLPDLLAHKLKVIMQRVEPKDYRDIAALLKDGQSLESGLAAASSLFGANFPASECVKALGYFDDVNLAELEPAIREYLIDQLRNRKQLPPIPPILSRSLSAR